MRTLIIALGGDRVTKNKNSHVLDRLQGIRSILMGIHASGAPISASSRGQERETFVREFLEQVLPPPFRFGTGVATDRSGSLSGQLDVVVEYPIGPSLPTSRASPRLYLAETVAAVIEVKSNAQTQWPEAVKTAKALAPLRRGFKSLVTHGTAVPKRIPLFVVGYKGWQQLDSIMGKVIATEEIAGVLILDSGLYFSVYGRSTIVTGDAALWALICDLCDVTRSIVSANWDAREYIGH